MWFECHSDGVLRTFQSSPVLVFGLQRVSDSPGESVHQADSKIIASEVLILGCGTV